MNVGLIAHESKKKLMQNFCIAYRGILSKHSLYATGTTGRLIEEVTNLNVHKYLSGHLGGEQQMCTDIEQDQLDLVQVELLWQQASTLVAQLQLQRSTQMQALAVLVGDPGLRLEPQTESLLALAPLQPLAPGLPSQLLENRPDILAAEHALQAANARIGAARAMYFPRIALTSSVGTASAELDGLFASGSRAWTFAPGIALPIFDGGRRRANLELSQVQRAQALNQYQQTIEAAFRDVANALAANQWLDEQLHTLRATQDTLTERARLAQRRFDAGATRYFEVLDAERDLLTAQQQVVQAEHALLSARLQLYAALGGAAPARPTAQAPHQP